jgi:hypothetical protein
VLAALTGLGPVKREGSGSLAHCPSHDDTHPSLRVDEKDGKVLLVCRSRGCPPEGIVSALGLRMRDLFPAGEGGGVQPPPARATVQPERLHTHAFPRARARVGARGQLGSHYP